MNATSTRPPTLQEIEDAALEVNRRVRQAVDHATAGDLRRARAEIETAQGLCRRLKERLGLALAAGEPRS